MKNSYIYHNLYKQIPIMLFLSLFPGLGYIFIGWLNGIMMPAVYWYLLVLALSIWGVVLYKKFNFYEMSSTTLHKWHQSVSLFYYLIFSSWAIIFLLYADEVESKMHYIAIFTELGAAVVASALLYADKRILRPILLVLMLPLSVYFFLIGEFFSYLLSLFALIFLGVLFYAANNSDKLLQKTYYQATHDQLTHLENRHSFISLLQRKLNILQKQDKFAYLLLIDLDHFKTINDSLGHDIGDLVLIEAAKRLQNFHVPHTYLARLGGDEFVFLSQSLLTHKEAFSHAHEVGSKILNALKKTYEINEHQLYLSASIGISILSGKSLEANAFIKEADIAMYEVKAKGRDGIILFNELLSERVQNHLIIEQKLHQAFEEDEIYLQYQPQVDSDKKVIGCEALARWQNKDLGFVPPDEFIPIAEQTGLIVPLGNYILEEAFKNLADWERKGIILKQFSINISLRQLFHPEFIFTVATLCETYLNETLQQCLVFEMTESMLAEDIPKVIFIIDALEPLGITFSMDDFGTGYSSLSYLRKIPVKELKIDKSFIQNLDESQHDQQMIETILLMAKSLDLRVVAEGVETQEQYAYLNNANCSVLQGYLFSKPLNAEEFEAFYHENNSLT